MRLVCPNCAAQYEVDETAIPVDGRDVQCASCDNTWFQDRGPGDAAEFLAAADEGLPQDQSSDQPHHDHDHDHAHHHTHADQSDDDETSEADLPDLPRSRPNTSVLDILRSEAEREAAARDAETPLSSEPDSDPQSDFAPDEHVAVAPDDEMAEQTLAERARAGRGRVGAAQDHTRPLAGPGPQQEMQPDYGVETAPKRGDADLAAAPELPDVDELNSTLRPANDRNRAKPKRGRKSQPKQQRVSGRLGFYLAILIFLALLAAYALKPQIVTALPQSETYLDSYVDGVDVLRRQVATGSGKLVDLIRDMLRQVL